MGAFWMETGFVGSVCLKESAVRFETVGELSRLGEMMDSSHWEYPFCKRVENTEEIA